jgi:hypothetical protein
MGEEGYMKQVLKHSSKESDVGEDLRRDAVVNFCMLLNYIY